jgi:Crp-like helix-turn-helix domain
LKFNGGLRFGIIHRRQALCASRRAGHGPGRQAPRRRPRAGPAGRRRPGRGARGRRGRLRVDSARALEPGRGGRSHPRRLRAARAARPAHARPREPRGPRGRARDDGTEERIVGLEPRWEVLEPARLLVLDAAFAQRIARYPALASGLVERVHERARRTAIALALSHLPRVEDRLHRLLWHLADRRGHVRADGIVLRLPVTQEQLGRLVGARRPTVSLALRSLRERGLVRRGEADEWVLANQPPVPES